MGKAYDRLRYFFWKHTDAETRIDIFHKIGALPLTLQAIKPLPQPEERRLLDRCQAHGQLSTLWDIVMGHVPKEEREDNPFTGGKA